MRRTPLFIALTVLGCGGPSDEERRTYHAIMIRCQQTFDTLRPDTPEVELRDHAREIIAGLQQASRLRVQRAQGKLDRQFDRALKDLGQLEIASRPESFIEALRRTCIECHQGFQYE